MDNKKQGRPRTPDYRKKRMRFAMVEDKLFPIILKMANGPEKNELLTAFEELKEVD